MYGTFVLHERPMFAGVNVNEYTIHWSPWMLYFDRCCLFFSRFSGIHVSQYTIPWSPWMLYLNMIVFVCFFPCTRKAKVQLKDGSACLKGPTKNLWWHCMPRSNHKKYHSRPEMSKVPQDVLGEGTYPSPPVVSPEVQRFRYVFGVQSSKYLQKQGVWKSRVRICR